MLVPTLTATDDPTCELFLPFRHVEQALTTRLRCDPGDLVDLFLWAEYVVPHTLFEQDTLTISTNRLEATFGVIAAAAPSVRPLMGHNSLTTDEYRSKSHSLPLHSLRTGRSSKRDIGHSLLQSREEMADRRWEGEGSQSQLWVPDEQGIVKTTSVEVVSSQSRVPPEKGNWDLEEFQ